MTTETTSATEPSQIEALPVHKAGYENGPLKLERDQFGLLKNVDYKFTETGHVSWREMIDPKFLYPNKGWFEARGEAVPDSIENLEDAQLLIQLGGIKELARLRGFESVTYRLKRLDENHVVAICTISWIKNYENPQYCTFESVANATTENTNGFGKKFLETIAENRAFVRAVRNFLNIHIVGADEIDKSTNKVVEIEDTNSSVLDPNSNLEKHAKKAGYSSFEQFRTEFLVPLAESKSYAPLEKSKSKWLSYKDIPAKECGRIILLLKNK